METIQKAISLAYEQTKLILFKPFHLKKWIYLAFIAIMAGTLAGGGGGGGGGNFGGPPPQNQKTSSTQSGQNTIDPHLNTPASKTPKSIQGSNQNVESDTSVTNPLNTNTTRTLTEADNPASDNVYKTPKITDPILITLVCLSFLLILSFILLFTWLNSRFRFIFYHNIVHNDYKIKENWVRYKTPGNSYFRFSLIIMLAYVGVLISIFGLLAAGLYFFGVFELGFQAIGIGAILFIASTTILSVFFLLAFALILHYITEFAIPIMAKDNCHTWRAIKTLKELVKTHKKPFLLYLPAAIIIGTILLTASAIIGVLLLIVWLLIFGPIGLLAYFILGSGTTLTITLIAILVPASLLLIGLSFITNLPIAVFYRAFSLYYLGLVSPSYDMFAQKVSEPSTSPDPLNPSSLPTSIPPPLP